MRGPRLLVFGAAGALGAALGWAAAAHQVRRHRSALFHPSAFRRMAALTMLERRATPDTLHTLRDYLQWERQPRLRRRATRVLRRLERSLA